MTRVLLVDPDAASRQQLRETLEQGGFAVLNCADRGHAAPTVIVASTAAVQGDALIAKAAPTPVVVVAEQPSIADAVAYTKQGAADYLPRPLAVGTLVRAVAAAAEQAHEEPQPRGPIIGEHPVMAALWERIIDAAQNDAPVLLHGEPGTGKELAARVIHAAGPRRNAPFIPAHCAAVPTTELAVELFGTGDGATTRRGLLAAAAGGALFVDEVGDLPLDAQDRLLRHMHAAEGRGHEPDVRIYAATRRDLDRLADTGLALPALVERLNGQSLPMPPLRERGEDVALIAGVFLKRTESKLGKQGLVFAPEAMDALRGHPWPGNVRELENAVERAAALCEGNEIAAEVLAIDAAPSVPTAATEQGTSGRLEDFFVRFVLANQDHCTETELASQLGISRKSLWERRQRLNIPRRRTQKRGSRRTQRHG